MDDLLPAYAKVIDEVCPCDIEEFKDCFNRRFMQYLPESERVEKTLDNHRTEVAGKLFGMYYASEDGRIYSSERTQKYLEDNDQPAFFKDICYKMQFPNGTQKIETVRQRVADEIRIRPNAFLLNLLLIARTKKVDITKKEVGYYVLNSYDVLRGMANPSEVLAAILQDKNAGIGRNIIVSGKESSYSWQHINEQMNYLELANLVRFTSDKRVKLNPNEIQTIEFFAADWDTPPEFDVYSFDLDTSDGRKNFQYEWDKYFSIISPYAYKFSTTAESLIVDVEKPDDLKTKGQKPLISSTDFGDEGEQVVFEYEKKRVACYDQRLVKKVLALGKTKGLGYDIQSVIAEPGEMAEFVKYIEVKSTKRLTCPDINDGLWIDTLNITRNEWVAATQHGDYYSFYRVYFTRDGILMFIIHNPNQKFKERKMRVTPITYRVDFGKSAVDMVVAGVQGSVNNV